MSAYREPPGRPPVVGEGFDDGVLDGGGPDGEGVGLVDGELDGVDGGVMDGFGGVGMMPGTDATPEPWDDTRFGVTPVQSRILCLPSRAGTSPWAPGFGPTRPVWDVLRLQLRGLPLRVALVRQIQAGLLPLDRSPILDVRRCVLTLATPQHRYWYGHLRGTMARALPRGVRLTAWVTWGPPNTRTSRNSHGGTAWASRWCPRAMGTVHVWPDLSDHSRPPSLPTLVDQYQRWFSPVLSWDSGLVLDTRMLARQGIPIPLPPMALALLRPLVRLLSLSDVPSTRTREFGLTPWMPGRATRYSRDRWCALLDQFPHTPVTLPACTSAEDIPPWLRDRLQARPPCLPEGVVWPPPDARAVWMQPRDPRHPRVRYKGRTLGYAPQRDVLVDSGAPVPAHTGVPVERTGVPPVR